MASYLIPLPSGESFIDFDIQIDDYFFTFELRWNLSGGFYMVNIYVDDEPLVFGKGLHPEIDLLKDLNLNIGKIYLEGQTATIDNLGLDNRLIHEEL